MSFKYFKLSEFSCPCCGKNNMTDITLKSLDLARERAGIPFKIISGTRCSKHNIEVEGEENSEHLVGTGADISAVTSAQKFKIINALLSVGCRRIGIYKNFIHAGFSSSHPSPVVWRGEY